MANAPDGPGATVLTVGEVLRRSAAYLGGRGVDTPRLDAEVLLADVLGCDRLALYTDHERPLTRAETNRYRDAVARRGRREPVAYIVGARDFRRLRLEVTSEVLIPRPETEHLVEWVCEVAPEGAAVLDWGTGSGAVALALATERPDLAVCGIDVSAAALAVARRNDRDDAVEWVESDGFAALADRSFDVVASNPPYIAAADLPGLAPELGHEPRVALVSGSTGLECYRRIAADAPAHLAAGGWLIAEIGERQADAVAEIWRAAGLDPVEVRRDLAGLDRLVGGST